MFWLRGIENSSTIFHCFGSLTPYMFLHQHGQTHHHTMCVAGLYDKCLAQWLARPSSAFAFKNVSSPEIFTINVSASQSIPAQPRGMVISHFKVLYCVAWWETACINIFNYGHYHHHLHHSIVIAQGFKADKKVFSKASCEKVVLFSPLIILLPSFHPSARPLFVL